MHNRNMSANHYMRSQVHVVHTYTLTRSDETKRQPANLSTADPLGRPQAMPYALAARGWNAEPWDDAAQWEDLRGRSLHQDPPLR